MKKLTMFALLLVNLALAVFLVRSIKVEIETLNNTHILESKIIKKLDFLRELQRIHKSQKGTYAKTWRDLERFATDDSIYICSNKESVEFNTNTQRELVTHKIDTLGSISVMDSIFSKTGYDPQHLSSVPGLSHDYTFELSAKCIKKQGLNIEVLEVKCPVKTNPRKSSRFLKFGSLESASLAGNWK